MSENFLSQEEIDALLKSQVVPEQETESKQEHQTSTSAGEEEDLTREERDVIGEIGNISMGSAATTLSDIVRHRVSITTPHVTLSNQKELFSSFVKPYVVIDINYIEGLTGSNLLLVGLTDAAIEAADVVVMNDALEKIPLAMEIARFTKRIVIQNIVLALGIKILVIILGTAGAASLWEAVFADVGVALLAVLNATRVLKFRVP